MAERGYEPVRDGYQVHGSALNGAELPAASHRRRAAAPVEVTKVNPACWRLSLQQAGGDTSRLEVISATKIIIHEPGWRRPPADPDVNKLAAAIQDVTGASPELADELAKIAWARVRHQMM